MADVESLDGLFDYARQCAGEKKFAEAIGALIPVTRADGHHLQYRAWLELGGAFMGLGDLIGAELAYRNAGVIDPGSHWPVRGLAEVARMRSGVAVAVALVEGFYETLRHDCRAQILGYVSAITAQENFGAARGKPDWRMHGGGSIPALADAVMMLMVKDEDDIIGQNLRHHYAMGFRRFCILDNGSTDATARVIAGFRAEYTQARVAYIHDPITGYYQSDKMIAAERFSEAYMAIDGAKPGWMFFVDADEFLTFAGGATPNWAERFNAALAAPEQNLLVLHWIHCAAQQVIGALEPAADPFAVFARVCTTLVPAVPKIAYRSGLGLRPEMGNHFVPEYGFAMDQVIHGSDFGIYLAHFPMRSLIQVRKKVINGGQAYRQASGLEIHGGHWRDRYALYEKHGDSVIGQMLANHIRDTR
jgi:hypothetical protein